MGHILTPEFLSSFDNFQDCSDPLIPKRLISLESIETWLIFSCNTQGLAYGYVFGEEHNESGSIYIPDLEKRFVPYITYYQETIEIPSVIADSSFSPKLLSEAKAEFEQEKDFAEDERMQMLMALGQALRG